VDNLEALGERSYSGYVEKANDAVEQYYQPETTCCHRSIKQAM